MEIYVCARIAFLDVLYTCQVMSKNKQIKLTENSIVGHPGCLSSFEPVRRILDLFSIVRIFLYHTVVVVLHFTASLPADLID